ncbi:MAG TPA: hypothetical protein VLE19_06705 [Pyrinomonadaceae bacterium]|nr:hypothetical protein [Pyrinomonadaceae bacterium]
MFATDLTKVVLVVATLLTCALVTMAQEKQPTPQPTPLTAPPPLRTISKEERTQIEAADSKQRLKLTIEFAGIHLTNAEKYTAQSNYEEASHEVGSYHALVKNALTFLATLKRDSNKTRDLYKRIELALRADGPRLTSLRRTTPLEFAVWIKEVEDFARESRTEALNSFYGQTVVREPQKPEEKLTDKPNP